MKANKLFMLALAAGAMVLGSCSNEDVVEPTQDAKPVTMVFTAGMENGCSTRTALNGVDVNWQTGDTIKVFDGSNVNPFTASNINGTNCDFGGSCSGTATNFYAVYPASAVGSSSALDGTTITNVTLPAEQTATVGSYDPAAAIMVATTTAEAKNFQFKNANSLIKVTPLFDCSKIIVTATGCNLAGTATVTVSATPTVAITDGSNVVTLNSPEGSYIQAGKTYYISVLPGQTASKIRVDFIAVASDDAGHLQFSKEKSGTINFTRNNIMNIGGFSKADCPASYYTNQPQVQTSFVDLGFQTNGKILGWATTNVNSSTAKPYGDYFAWGETSPYYDSYTMSGTTVNATFSGEKAYTSDYYSTQDASSISTNLSGNTQDAATKYMGTNWRMPSMDEYTYLATKCVWVYTTMTHNGLSTGGYKIFRAKDPSHAGYVYAYDTGTKTGKTAENKWMKSKKSSGSFQTDTDSYPDVLEDEDLISTLDSEYRNASSNTSFIFIPASGYFSASGFYYGGNIGFYWSSTCFSEAFAYNMNFCNYYLNTQFNLIRYEGRTVRGVCQ